ncbi:MAG: hypothetical protein EOP53_23240 [Sphingobacteriales bacterium]|nr:MAG: hypothetical protein EOP53_23240 [Sphingobacteriales bacterium]
MKTLRILTVAIFALFILQSCKNDSALEKIRITSRLSLKLPMEEYTKAGLTKEKLAKYGWSYKDGFIILDAVFPNKEVTLGDGTKIMTDEDSYIQVKNYSGGAPVKINLEGNSYNLKMIQNTAILDVPSYLLKMDGGCCGNVDKLAGMNAVSRLQYVAGNPRCVDYNGPMGNGQNDSGFWQESINFIGSTCSLAVAQGNCWGEHMDGTGGCYQNHGGRLCGELIRPSHPSRDGGLSKKAE